MSQNIRSGKVGTGSNPLSLFGYIKPSRIQFGENPPLASQFENQHYYIDTLSGQMWFKEGGQWSTTDGNFSDLALLEHKGTGQPVYIGKDGSTHQFNGIVGSTNINIVHDTINKDLVLSVNENGLDLDGVLDLDDLGDVDVSTVPPNPNDVLKWDGANWTPAVDATGAGGETNTASNLAGTAGSVGLFKQKTGVDLEFKKVNAGSNKVSIVDDVGNDEVDIDVNEGNITISNLSGAGDYVTKTGSDTLTNKTMDYNNNTFQNFPIVMSAECREIYDATYVSYDLTSGIWKEVILDLTTPHNTGSKLVHDSGNSSIKYIGTSNRVFMLNGFFSCLGESDDRVMEFGISINGNSPNISTQMRFTQMEGEYFSISNGDLQDLDTNDFVQLCVRSITNNDNLTVRATLRIKSC